MVVTFNTQSGPMTAVLKLYDRRFGPQFRERLRTYIPHTSEDEAIWQQYVHGGMAAPFFDQMEKDDAEYGMSVPPRRYYQDSWQGRAQFEGALQRQALQYFDVETKAYDILIDLQGACIPTMLAHVRVLQPLPDPAENEVYFRIPGILLQFIDGCSLWRLADPERVPKMDDLRHIVQMAVNTADAINDLGVLMLDCRPQNVIVERGSRRPFLHDFAQCYFRDSEYFDDPGDPDDPFTYQDAVSQNGNSRAIGMVMETRIKRERGYNLNIQYRPDSRL